MSARNLLKHKWLMEEDDYNIWMSKGHLNEFRTVNKHKFPNFGKEEEDKTREDEEV